MVNKGCLAMQISLSGLKNLVSGSSCLSSIRTLSNGNFLRKCRFPTNGEMHTFFSVVKGEAKCFS